MHVDPHVLVAAAIELEASAGRLAQIAATAGPTLHVAPAGSEEVSLSAAGYFNTAAQSFDTSAAQAARALTEAAEYLRRYAESYLAEDATTRGDLAATPL